MNRKYYSSFSVLVIFLLFSLVGLLLIPKLSVQLFPSGNYSSLTVVCYLHNASPELTENELTSPLTSALNRLKGVKSVSSTSGFGDCTIELNLHESVDPNIFRLEVASAIRQLYDKLPEGSSYPQVLINRPVENSSTNSSILTYTLSGPKTTNEIVQIAEKLFRPLSTSVKGVFKFEVTGARKLEILIIPNEVKIRTIGLKNDAIIDNLRFGLIGEDLGMIKTDFGSLNVSMAKTINDVSDLADFNLMAPNTRVFDIKSLAVIKEDLRLPSSYYRINGQEQVTLNFYPEKNVNTLNLAATIKEKINLYHQKLPSDFTLTLAHDSTETIAKELKNVYIRSGLSICLLIVFILIITRRGRYAIVIFSSLFVNILISFIFYYLFKVEIHLYSLAGITISLGLMTDNVILIVEDVRKVGKTRIFAAILASTLTTLGSLLVIFFLNEFQKISLIDFANSIIINLLVSLPVAYLFIPAFLDKFPIPARVNKEIYKRRRWIVYLNRSYTIILKTIFRSRRAFIVLFILAFGLPVFLIPDTIDNGGLIGQIYNKTFGSFFYIRHLKEPFSKYLGGALYFYIRRSSNVVDLSDENSKTSITRLEIEILMPHGATMEQMNLLCMDFETYLRTFKSQLNSFNTRIFNANSAQISIIIDDAKATMNFAYQLKGFLEVKSMSSGAADFKITGVGRGFSNVLDAEKYDSSIKLTGYNMSDLQAIALRVRDSLIANPRVRNTMITTRSRFEKKGNFEYVASFADTDYEFIHYINNKHIKSALSQIKNERVTIGNINVENNSSSPVIAILTHSASSDIWSTLNSPLQINDTTSFKLNRSSISRIKKSDNIIRQNQKYILNVHYEFLGPSELNSRIKDRTIKSFRKILPFGYEIFGADETTWNGSDVNKHYLWLILLVIVIIYIICAILLESLTLPISVICMIPFSFIGSFLMFSLLELKFDQGAYASLLMLAGLSTNSALYIINDFNFFNNRSALKPSRRLSFYLKSFNSKAMPILITTSSAIISLIPFLYGNYDAGFWFTLSVGTIGGLAFSLLGVYLLLPFLLLRKSEVYVDSRIEMLK